MCSGTCLNDRVGLWDTQGIDLQIIKFNGFWIQIFHVFTINCLKDNVRWHEPYKNHINTI